MPTKRTQYSSLEIEKCTHAYIIPYAYENIVPGKMSLTRLLSSPRETCRILYILYGTVNWFRILSAFSCGLRVPPTHPDAVRIYV